MNVWRVVGLVNRSLRGVLVGEIEDSHHRAAPKSAKLDINIYFPTNQTNKTTANNNPSTASDCASFAAQGQEISIKNYCLLVGFFMMKPTDHLPAAALSDPDASCVGWMSGGLVELEPIEFPGRRGPSH